jgi:hypothetical protein
MIDVGVSNPTTFVPTFWTHIISELGGVDSQVGPKVAKGLEGSLGQGYVLSVSKI